MARKSRVHLPSGFYHVMMRGNGGSDIFFSTADRTRFLFFIQEGIERYGHRVHAFCLMNNHVHLLIQVGTLPLSDIIQNLSFRYTRYVNRQKRSVGHLFQGRYRAILVDADNYLLELSRYIHLNPVRAGVCELPDSYEWSSHLAYSGKMTIPWLHTDEVLARFSNELNRAIELYLNFIEKGMTEPRRLDFHQGSHQGRILGDDHFAEMVLHASEQSLNKPPELTDIIIATCKVYDVDPSSLCVATKSRPQSEVRAMIAMIVQDTPERTLTDLAEAFQCGISQLSQAGARLRKRIKRDERLQERLDSAMNEIQMLKCQS
ncbi:MAG: transposase [Zetaproteobacteria bacterium CG_4_9_14_3_um_filter_49_83]|nr:MAG: transposase [Zetaproteobacteria bacterium CG1_02_49_23]PIQ32003.1 MAG: transposase [Zetaproteobacteria bacterium CG17_big_fil_post_rev_8_21_14_2_50_50_13]PIV29674.1 MAG: transposase [Zetaproteobacteria bacterium CG02_land_8_20_14_3_00_50_9]PIY56712.1 MAG: transposase [Zetaproteobacteria bacterium CG_4_10_14_0_8_um_filter_49_80]PJA36482.1 MAG: transposase [Zetaproteobacteria bacterium CG_4_9_14_3_um_filter_49_83]